MGSAGWIERRWNWNVLWMRASGFNQSEPAPIELAGPFRFEMRLNAARRRRLKLSREGELHALQLQADPDGGRRMKANVCKTQEEEGRRRRIVARIRGLRGTRAYGGRCSCGCGCVCVRVCLRPCVLLLVVDGSDNLRFKMAARVRGPRDGGLRRGAVATGRRSGS